MSKSRSRNTVEAYEVLTYSDVIPYAMAIEPSCPFLSDELAVCHKGVDAFRSEETDKVFHNLLAFLPVGVATFRGED